MSQSNFDGRRVKTWQVVRWPWLSRPEALLQSSRQNGPLGLAELMFLRSTPGRMGNLLIPITAPRNQIGLRRFVIWG